MNELRKHLAQLVDFESYDNRANTLNNVSLQLFEEVVRHDKRRKTLAEKFTEAVQGLPSYLNLPFYNGEIENLMYSIGHDKEEDLVSKYWEEVGEILAEEMN